MLARLFGIALALLALHKTADAAFCQATSLTLSSFARLMRIQNSDLTQVWNTVGIPQGEFSFAEGTEFRSLGDGSNADVVAVHVWPNRELHRVVLFRREEQPSAVWRVAGYVNYRDRASEAPHRLWRSSLGDFLLVHDETNSGSGIGSETTTWYQIDKNGVRSVLSYPSSAFEAGFWMYAGPLSPNRTIRSRIKSVGSFEGVQEVTIGLSVVFQDRQTNVVVCRVEKNLVFTRRDDKAFVLDSRRSAAMPSDIDVLFDISKISPLERLQSYCPPGAIRAR